MRSRGLEAYKHAASENLSEPEPAGLLRLLASSRPDRRALCSALAALPQAALPRLIADLSFHRIDGLAYRNIRALPSETIDPWLRCTLKRRSQKLAAATLAQGLALAELLDALHHARIPTIVMRGLRSAESIYEDPSVRPFEDHDLLVLPGDRASAATTFERHGLEPISAGLFRRGGLLIDLHVDSLGAERRPTRARLARISTQGLFERARAGTVAGAPAFLLDPADELLLLAIHVVKHSFDRLIRIADVAHLLARPEGGAIRDAARRRAEGSAGRRILDWVIVAAAPLGLPTPPALHATHAPGRIESFLMRRVVELRPLPYAGEILMSLALSGWTARLRFLCDALFPTEQAPRATRRSRFALSDRTVAIVRHAVGETRARREAR